MALRYSGRETDFFARVDTGASFCIFQRLRAETVGIAVESGSPTRISTVAGSFVAYAHQIALDVLSIVPIVCLPLPAFHGIDPAQPAHFPMRTWGERRPMAFGIALYPLPVGCLPGH